MKYTKSEITGCVESLEKYARRLARLEKSYDDLERTAASIQAEIDKIGTPSYTDDAAIQQLTVLERKLQLCRAELDKMAAKIDLELNGDTIAQGLKVPASMAAGVIEEIVERRLETITCVFAPFSRDAFHATALARKSDAFAAAYAVLQQFSMVQNRLFFSSCSLASIRTEVEKTIEVLSEAAKPVPNLMRFLPMQPAEAAPTTGDQEAKRA